MEFKYTLSLIFFKTTLIITEGLIKLGENDAIVTKTIDYSKLIIEKQPTIKSKKIDPINSLKREIKILDRTYKKSEYGIVTSILNNKVEVVSIESKLIGK